MEMAAFPRARRRVLALGLALPALTAGWRPASAQGSAPLLFAADIQEAARPGFLGVARSSAGAVHYPDEALAFPVAETAENRELLTAWQNSHRFFVLPLNLGIDPARGFTPEELHVGVNLGPLGQPDRQPLLIDSFPKTGFAPGAVGLRGELRLGADLKLADLVPAAAPAAGGSAALTVTYAPAFANVVSGFGSGTAFWRFLRSQQTYPVGDLPLRIVAAVPLARLGQALPVAVDVRLVLSGPWWRSGEVNAVVRSRVLFPQG